MGADCHDFYIERNSYDSSWWIVAQIQTDRDYTAFGVLAGVRRDELEHIEPRGYPSQMCWQMADHKSEDCHSATWLTTDEMVEAQIRYVKEQGEPYEPLAYAITVMRMAEEHSPGKPIRAVFCFDN